MSQQQIIVEAKSAEKAIEKGLNRLGQEREQVEIEIIQEEQPGLFNQNARNARVKMIAEGPDLENLMRRQLKNLLDLLDLKDYSLEIEIDETSYRGLIKTKEPTEKLIGPDGKTINSIQSLVEQQLNEYSEESVNVILDSEGYRKRRRQELIRSTRYYGQEVIETGEEVELDPMIKEERKIVLETVEQINGVNSQVIGEGLRRRIELVPAGES